MDYDLLDKTNRINRLFDFYEQLLTAKQQTFLKLYFHDDYSLGEIAAEFNISRQAVFEHIKRSEAILEEYESKLQLLNRHERRQDLIRRIIALQAGQSVQKNLELAELLDALQKIDYEPLP